MKRTLLFLYYLWALLTPVQDVNIWSVSLAWRLAGIAAKSKEPTRRQGARTMKRSVNFNGFQPKHRTKYNTAQDFVNACRAVGMTDEEIIAAIRKTKCLAQWPGEAKGMQEDQKKEQKQD